MVHIKIIKGETIKNCEFLIFNVILFIKNHQNPFGNYFCFKILNKGNNSYHWHFLINPSFTSLYFLKCWPMHVDFLDNFSERYESKSNSIFDQCTEVRFASFLSCDFTTMAVIDPPERKLAKRTSVHWSKVFIIVLFSLEKTRQITIHWFFASSVCIFINRWRCLLLKTF